MNIVLGVLDTADYYGPQDNLNNVLHLLGDFKILKQGDQEMCRKIGKVIVAIEQGKLKLADDLLVPIFNSGGQNRAVYHAIAYAREKLGR